MGTVCLMLLVTCTQSFSICCGASEFVGKVSRFYFILFFSSSDFLLIRAFFSHAVCLILFFRFPVFQRMFVTTSPLDPCCHPIRRPPFTVFRLLSQRTRIRMAHTAPLTCDTQLASGSNIAILVRGHAQALYFRFHQLIDALLMRFFVDFFFYF
jgi:hypothetical protein